ncbi:hypothetical protein QBC36DRAFT_163967, partial [Triangularia setosa]
PFPTISIRQLPAHSRLGSYHRGPRTSGGSSTPRRAVILTMTQFITFETLKSIEKGGKIGSQTARVKNSVRGGTMFVYRKECELNYEKPKHNKNAETEPPAPRYLTYFHSGGGP